MVQFHIKVCFSFVSAKINILGDMVVPLKKVPSNCWSNMLTNSSRLDTGLVHDPKLTWASGESETKGKGGLES